MLNIRGFKRRVVSIVPMVFAGLIVAMTAQVAHAQDIRAVRREIVFTRENQRRFDMNFSGSMRADATLEITSLNDSGSFAGKLDIGTVHPSSDNVSGTITIIRGSGPAGRNALRITFSTTLETRLELIGSSTAPRSERGPIPTPGDILRRRSGIGIITTTVYTFEGALRLRTGDNRTFMAGTFTVTTDNASTGVQSAPGPYPFCAKLEEIPVG